MAADYLFDVKNIDICALAFFKHNNSFIATVHMCHVRKQDATTEIKSEFIFKILEIKPCGLVLEFEMWRHFDTKQK